MENRIAFTMGISEWCIESWFQNRNSIIDFNRGSPNISILAEPALELQSSALHVSTLVCRIKAVILYFKIIQTRVVYFDRHYPCSIITLKVH